MPDLDHLPYNVRRHWRKSGTVAAVSGRQDQITVADCSEKAMAAALREGAAEHLGLLAEGLRVAPTDRPGEVDRIVGTLPRPWVVGIGRCFVDAARLLARGLDQPDSASHTVGLAELTMTGLRRMAWQQWFRARGAGRRSGIVRHLRGLPPVRPGLSERDPFRSAGRPGSQPP